IQSNLKYLYTVNRMPEKEKQYAREISIPRRMKIRAAFSQPTYCIIIVCIIHIFLCIYYGKIKNRVVAFHLLVIDQPDDEGKSQYDLYPIFSIGEKTFFGFWFLRLHYFQMRL